MDFYTPKTYTIFCFYWDGGSTSRKGFKVFEEMEEEDKEDEDDKEDKDDKDDKEDNESNERHIFVLAGGL